MPTLFVSYSRADEGKVNHIVEDMEALGHDVWFDHELSGGQNWWEKILQEIRQADIFVFVLSPASRKSSACSREYKYAHALGKPIVPLQVAEGISVNLLPPELSEIQIVNYLQSDRNAAFRLARSLSGIRSFEPLPDPLPEPPAVPVSYVGTISQKVESNTNLSYEEQSVLLLDIKKCLRDSDVTDSDAIVLLKEFRNRRDLLVSTAEEIDILLKKLELSEKETEKKTKTIEALKTKQEAERKKKEAAELSAKQSETAELEAKKKDEPIPKETTDLASSQLSEGKNSQESVSLNFLKQEQKSPKKLAIPFYKGVAVAVSIVLAVATYLYTQEQDNKSKLVDELSAISQSKPITPERLPFEPEMVSIPAGSFTMGCIDKRDDVEGGCSNDEKPPHIVYVNAFQMGKYEITVGQYMACVDEDICPNPAWKEIDAPDYYKKLGDGLTSKNYPMVGVSWDNAQIYAQWLKKKTGKAYRLATEAEWEYAARGGDNEKAYPWGNKASHDYMNYGQDECCDGLAIGKDKWKYTSPVGSFPANGFGLYDMHGNVWEWVQDAWHDDYKGAPVNGEAWKVSESSSLVVRGGSWLYYGRNVRSACRSPLSPDYRDNRTGFRLLLGH